MKNLNLLAAFFITLCAITYFILPSLSAGIFMGIFSFFLIQLFLQAIIRFGSIRTIILLVNVLKFGMVISMLFIFIRWFKMDAFQVALGYTVVFITTITEIFIRRPEEL